MSLQLGKTLFMQIWSIYTDVNLTSSRGTQKTEIGSVCLVLLYVGYQIHKSSIFLIWHFSVLIHFFLSLFGLAAAISSVCIHSQIPILIRNIISRWPLSREGMTSGLRSHFGVCIMSTEHGWLSYCFSSNGQSFISNQNFIQRSEVSTQ